MCENISIPNKKQITVCDTQYLLHNLRTMHVATVIQPGHKATLIQLVWELGQVHNVYYMHLILIVSSQTVAGTVSQQKDVPACSYVE